MQILEFNFGFFYGDIYELRGIYLFTYLHLSLWLIDYLIDSVLRRIGNISAI